MRPWTLKPVARLQCPSQYQLINSALPKAETGDTLNNNNKSPRHFFINQEKENGKENNINNIRKNKLIVFRQISCWKATALFYFSLKFSSYCSQNTYPDTVRGIFIIPSPQESGSLFISLIKAITIHSFVLVRESFTKNDKKDCSLL